MNLPTDPDHSSVLVVVTNADLAGAPTHVRDLVDGSRGKYSLTVAFGENGPIKSALSASGIPTVLLPRLASRISPWADFLTAVSLIRLIKKVKPKLIHAHSSKAGLISRLAGRIMRVPVLFTVHGWGFGPGRPKWQSRLVYLSERIMARFGAGYIAVSKADAREGERALNLCYPIMRVVHNGVADSNHRASPKTNSGVMMVARVSIQKDHEVLFKAFANTKTSMKLTCIGPGTDSSKFRNQASAWCGETIDQVSLMGGRTDVAEQLASQAIFVLTSRWEGLPISIIEALRAGLPIIGTDTGGVNELVEDGVNGFLVPAGATEVLQSRLQTLIDDPDLRERMGQQSRQRYENNFKVDKMCHKINAIYDELINANDN